MNNNKCDNTGLVMDGTALPSRRDMLCRIGGGFGALALNSVLASEAKAVTTPPTSYTLEPKA